MNNFPVHTYATDDYAFDSGAWNGLANARHGSTRESDVSRDLGLCRDD